MHNPFIILLIFLISVAVLCGIWARFAAKKRIDSLEQWAHKNGLRFERKRTQHLVISCPCVFFTDGDLYVQHPAQGEWRGREFLGFDYQYKIGKYSYCLSAVVLGSDRPLKQLLIRPEEIADRAWKKFEGEDINFESADFNRAFYVSATERKWAYDVIHPRMMEFLLSMPRFMIGLGQRHVVVFRDGVFTAQEFQQAAEVADGILSRLPEYITQV